MRFSDWSSDVCSSDLCDLKRGRGGIREVEFHAQILQMIYGGREPAVRAPATLDALQALATAGRLDAGIADDLAESYRVYRTIEHRLQMVADQQRSGEHTSELQSLMRTSYAVFCLKKKQRNRTNT